MNLLNQPRAAAHRYVSMAGRQCLDTGRVVIGACHTPRMPVCTRDGETLQEALLEPRTAKPLSPIYAAVGKVVAWL